MTFDFHEEALGEYQAAGIWYEEQRQNLGREFAEAVEAGIQFILKDPSKNRSVGDGIQVFRIKRFPYHIYYRFYQNRDHVRIAAIAHFKRQPEYWRGRLPHPPAA